MIKYWKSEAEREANMWTSLVEMIWKLTAVQWNTGKKRQAFFSQLEKSIFLNHSITENAFLLSNIYFSIIHISKELVLFQGKIQYVLAFINVFFDPYWNAKDKFVDIFYSPNVLGNLVANSREPIKTNQTMAFFYQDTFPSSSFPDLRKKIRSSRMFMLGYKWWMLLSWDST